MTTLANHVAVVFLWG